MTSEYSCSIDGTCTVNVRRPRNTDTKQDDTEYSSYVKPISTREQFKKAISDGQCFIDAYATWCGPCTKFAPTYAKIASEHPILNFYKMDIDIPEIKQIADKLKIKTLPTFLLYANGERIMTVQDEMDYKKKIEDIIDAIEADD